MNHIRIDVKPNVSLFYMRAFWCTIGFTRAFDDNTYTNAQVLVVATGAHLHFVAFGYERREWFFKPLYQALGQNHDGIHFLEMRKVMGHYIGCVMFISYREFGSFVVENFN